MVDSYTLVFAGLLLTAGSLGDRFGRRGALQLGLVVFGDRFDRVGDRADSPGQLIATRALMGIGGAFIMPATLSIDHQRLRGQGAGPGDRGVGRRRRARRRHRPARPAGFLLEHFYWGSIFLVNVPIVVVAPDRGRW